MTNIAVIGAGIADLVCAQQLSQAVYLVVVVQKSRGLGGKLASRQTLLDILPHPNPSLSGKL